MPAIATLTVEFVAGIARLEKDVKQAAGAVRQAAEQIDSAIGFAKTALLSLAGALGIGSFAGMIKGAADAADAAREMGQRFSIATADIIGLQHAAALAGVQQETLNVALRKLATNVYEAARGSEEARDKFQQLGLNANELSKLPLNQQFEILIDRLGGVENSTQRVALAQGILGRSGSEMLSIVADGSQAIRQATADTKAWGLGLNEIDAAKIDLAKDALLNAKAATQGFFTSIAVQLSPALKALADEFSNSAKASDGFKDSVTGASDEIIKLSANIANWVQGLRFAWAAAKVGVAEFLNLFIQAEAALARLGERFGAKRGPLSSSSEELQLAADAYKEILIDLHEELDAIAAQGLPGERMIEIINKARAGFDALAKDAADKRKDLGGTGADIEIPERQPNTDAFSKSLRQRLEQLRTSLLDEDELLAYHYNLAQTTLAEALGLRLIIEQDYQITSAELAQKFLVDRDKKQADEQQSRLLNLEDKYRTDSERDEIRYAQELSTLDYALANERITQQEHDRLLEQIELEHQAKLGNLSAQGQLERLRFTKMTGLQQTAFVLDFLQQQTQGVATQNRAMFNLNKAVGIAQAIMSTYIGANKALEWGWPLGPIFAAVIIAAGLANVARIASSKFESSTSAPSISGGSAIPVTQVSASPPPPALATPVPIPAAPRAQFNLTLIGSHFTYEQVVDELIPLINEASGNGADIRVQST